MSGYFIAPRVAWGPGALEQLSGLGAHHAAVLVDAAMRQHEGTRRVVEELAKADTATTNVPTAPTGPTVDEVTEVVERLRAHPPDLIVAVGGGRVLDLAKAVRLLLAHPSLDLTHPPALLPNPSDRRALLVAAPTTSGSGAEASWAVDLRLSDGVPLEVVDRSIIPEWALVDPAFAASLPAELILDGAAEALALAAESFLSAWANPFSDALALDAAATVVQRLPHAIRWSDDPDARSALHYAATAAGLAASNAQRGLAHALARALEIPTGLRYGRLLAIVLPSVLEFDHPSARDRLEYLARRVSGPEDRGPVPLAQRVRRLFEQLRVPATIRAAGVALGDWDGVRPTVVAHTMRSPAVLANPRVPSAAELGLLADAVVGV